MNTIENGTVQKDRSFLKACTASCQKAVARLRNARRSLFNEFRSRLHFRDRLLYLALNEAEAMAQETEFPLLVFPTLAREKAEALAAWDRKQVALLATAFEMAA